MTNALVVRSDGRPQSQTTRCAAQYIRMSTDLQQYSLENQAAAIAAYAQAHDLRIVSTYADKGESGLSIKSRHGLIRLIDDIQHKRAAFDHILIFDVSRWGRFQDIDESAHYEFICKENGIKVAYCAEQFDNDGSLISSIVKNIKRVMAAEYSRELSAKVHAGACRYARLGFKAGGVVGYGLRRQLVDENSKPTAILKSGQHKYLSTQHVRVCPGSADEVATVRWIFEMFLQQKSQEDIARELNCKKKATNTGRPWNRGIVGRILRNEAYIGNLIYNRRSFRLREKYTYNPPDLWIRSEGCVEAIIDQDLFLRAQKIIERHSVRISEEEMLKRLRKVLMKKGALSASIIDATSLLPSAGTYLRHFGSLRDVYRLIDYNAARHRQCLEACRTQLDIKVKYGALLREAFDKARSHVIFDPSIQRLRVNGAHNIDCRIAHWQKPRSENDAPRWGLWCRGRLAASWTVAVRLSENNREILDYLLLRTEKCEACYLKFSEKARNDHRIERFETFEALALSLILRVVGMRPSVSPDRQPSNASYPIGRARNKYHRGRR
jgi:DNA invertase Pin-like site-specific DNA recombinase